MQHYDDALITVNATSTVMNEEILMKVKYVITVPVVDVVPEGEKPLKKKAVLEAVVAALGELNEVAPAQLTLGKAKITEA